MTHCNSNARRLLIPVIALACIGMGACATDRGSRSTVRETERVYRGSEEVCRERVVTEQRRDRDNDRTRTSTTETVCRDRR